MRRVFLSLSHLHTHAHTHAHKRKHIHTHTHTNTLSCIRHNVYWYYKWGHKLTQYQHQHINNTEHLKINITYQLNSLLSCHVNLNYWPAANYYNFLSANSFLTYISSKNELAALQTQLLTYYTLLFHRRLFVKTCQYYYWLPVPVVAQSKA
jgi:hypothetical protein